MSDTIIPEIRQLQTAEDPLFRQARLVNDQAHHYLLEWNDNSQHYVAMAPDEPEKVAGVLQLLYPNKAKSTGYGDAHITRLAVDTTYRRRGIGSALVAHAVEVGKEAGLMVMSAQTMTAQAGSVFEKCGFAYNYRPGRKSYFRYLELGGDPTA